MIPRVPGGEITAERLIVIGTVAKKYNLYCKITGGQRIDMFGARKQDLVGIWTDLVEAGMEIVLVTSRAGSSFGLEP